MEEREAVTDGMSPAEIAGELSTLVENLAARLKESPNDGDAWRLLSRTYQELGRHGDAAKAFARTAEMFPEDADLRAYEGENLVYEAGGTVTPRALRAFEAALVLDPEVPAARYYVGLARFQAGQYRLAYEGWLALAEATDPAAPWLPDLQRDINEAADKLGIDAKQIVTTLAPADPPDADPTDAETEEFIRGMVERLAGKLADNPADADGWMRLGRARTVLGEIDAAAMAYGKAAKLRPKDLEAQLASAHASLKTVPRGTPVPEPVIARFRRVLELDPKNFDGLWFSGLGHLQDGNTMEVRRLWEQALAGLTSDDPRRALVTEQLDTLKPR
ncbi:MAG: tetratricopeptide repeat protein [Rhodospirillaceae bacterium]|nr:tetratricopeptide repeat protein [Rhodospirillaceae bacterium]